MDCEKIFKHEFKNILNKFNMLYTALDKDQFAIVGNGFALVFTVHLGEVSIRYAMPNSQSELEIYNFDLFIVEKFNAFDREGIIKSVTIEEKVSNELKIIARGLMNHWQGLLEGNKCWVEEYYARFGVDGKPYKAHRTIIDKLGHLIS